MSKFKVGDKIRCIEDNGVFHIGEIKKVLIDGYLMKWNNCVNRHGLSNTDTDVFTNTKDFIENDCELDKVYNTALWKVLNG